MKKFRCTVCGYVYEGDAAPEKCPLCKAPASKFVEVVEVEGGALSFADEHVIGVAKGCDEEMIKDLNNHFCLNGLRFPVKLFRELWLNRRVLYQMVL